MSVAQTILDQLGGGRFVMMVGVHKMSNFGTGLAFMFKATAKARINHVRVTLMPSDLYKIEFSRVWGTKRAVLTVRENIYADQLQTLFTEVTGLYTKF